MASTDKAAPTSGRRKTDRAEAFAKTRTKAESDLTRSLGVSSSAQRVIEKARQEKQEDARKEAARVVGELLGAWRAYQTPATFDFAIAHVFGGDHPPMSSLHFEIEGVSVAAFQPPNRAADVKQLQKVGCLLKSEGGQARGSEFLAAAAMGAEQSLHDKVILLCDCLHILEYALRGNEESCLCASTINKLRAHFLKMPEEFGNDTEKDKAESSQSLELQLEALVQILNHALNAVLRTKNNAHIEIALAACEKMTHPSAKQIVEDALVILENMRREEDLADAWENLMATKFEIRLGPPSPDLLDQLVHSEFVPDEHANALRDYALQLARFKHHEERFFPAICHLLFIHAPDCKLSELLPHYQSAVKASERVSFMQDLFRDFRKNVARRLCTSMRLAMQELQLQSRNAELFDVCVWCRKSLAKVAGEFAKNEVDATLVDAEAVVQSHAKLKLQKEEKKPKNTILKTLLDPFRRECLAIARRLGIHYPKDIEPVVDMLIQVNVARELAPAKLYLELASSANASSQFRHACFVEAVPYVEALDIEAVSVMATVTHEFAREQGPERFLSMFDALPKITQVAMRVILSCDAQGVGAYDSANAMTERLKSPSYGAYLDRPIGQWEVAEHMRALLTRHAIKELSDLVSVVISVKRMNFGGIILAATNGGEPVAFLALLASSIKGAGASYANFVAELVVQMGILCKGDEEIFSQIMSPMRGDDHRSRLPFQAWSIAWVEMKVRSQSGQDVEFAAYHLWAVMQSYCRRYKLGVDERKAVIAMAIAYQKDVHPRSGLKESEKFLKQLCLQLHLKVSPDSGLDAVAGVNLAEISD